MAGGVTKKRERTRVFEISTHPISVEELNRYAVKYGKKDCQIEIAYESEMTLAEAKEKYPEWYERRIVNKQKREPGSANVTFMNGGSVKSRRVLVLNIGIIVY